jgi:hypothetical protein
MLGLRLPEEYRPWVAHDVTTKSYVPWRITRTIVWGLVLVALYAVAQHAMFAWPSRRTLQIMAALVAVYGLLNSSKVLVRRELRWQRIDKQGRPVPPKGHARLVNAEVAALVAVVALLWTGGSAVFGYGLRPNGDVACRKPTPDTMERIKGGITHPGATIAAVESVPFAGGEMVGLVLKPPPSDGSKKPQGQFELLIVNGEQIYSFTHTKENPGWTRFDAPPHPDRLATEALRRLTNCLGASLRP